MRRSTWVKPVMSLVIACFLVLLGATATTRGEGAQEAHAVLLAPADPTRRQPEEVARHPHHRAHPTTSR